MRNSVGYQRSHLVSRSRSNGDIPKRTWLSGTLYSVPSGQLYVAHPIWLVPFQTTCSQFPHSALPPLRERVADLREMSGHVLVPWLTPVVQGCHFRPSG